MTRRRRTADAARRRVARRCGRRAATGSDRSGRLVTNPATPAPTPAPTIADVPPTISVLRLTSIRPKRSGSASDISARHLRPASPGVAVWPPTAPRTRTSIADWPRSCARAATSEQRGRPGRQVVGNSQCVKNFRGHALMTERREVDAIAGPQARIAKLGEPPEVDQLQTEVVGDAAQQLVVDRGAAPQPPKQRHRAEIARREREHVGAGLLQSLQRRRRIWPSSRRCRCAPAAGRSCPRRR